MDNTPSSDFGVDGQGESLSTTKVQTFYESLLLSTKEAFNGYENEIHKTSFDTYFATVLEDCWSCITCALEDLTKRILSESPVQIDIIVDYLNDSVFILQMLLNLYKHIIDSVSMSCCLMKMLPKQTGLIILSVFGHCKDSESIYGDHLKSVEKQLKDLFRICHELQLTYLLILEKHFKFDLNDTGDRTVLADALQINLSIGKVVHALDVKTMAEQWKGYIAICQKYSSHIGDSKVFVDCSKVLCELVNENIESAVETNQDEKVILRSLKVASFTIKILVKLCNIFKPTKNNYKYIMGLLKYIKINNACLEKSSESSFAALMNNNLKPPTDSLLRELLLDAEFTSCLVMDVSSSVCRENNMSDDDVLGLLLVVTSAMKCAIHGKRENGLIFKLIISLYILLPRTHTFMHRRIFAEHHSRFSIFEHTLTHTAALALTMTKEDFSSLESYMVEAILGTECVRPLFFSNLWIILARYISPQLLFNQLIWLCTMYKKLDTRKGFLSTPQHVHLSYTLSRLFKVIDDEDKLKFCKQFRIHDEDNMTLWTALRIRNLPAESQPKAEEVILEKLRMIYGKLHETDKPDLLISITNLAATCTFETTTGIDHHVVRAWCRLCQEKQTIVDRLYSNTVWFYDYIQALVALTNSVVDKLKEKSANFVKVLHVVSGLTKTGDADLKLILTKIICEIANCEVNEHKNLIDIHITDAFISLLQNSDEIVQMNLLKTLRTYRNTNLDRRITNIVKENSLQETWQNLNEKYDTSTFKSDNKYTHKCLNNNIDVPTMSMQEMKEAHLDDFYFDSDGSEMLVVAEVEEPCSKKGKPNTHEADSIIRNLEENVSLLVSQTAFTPEQIIRIQKVCEKLKNISH